MKLDNHIIPFQLGGNRVRGSIVRLGTAVSEIINKNDFSWHPYGWAWEAISYLKENKMKQNIHLLFPQYHTITHY